MPDIHMYFYLGDQEMSEIHDELENVKADLVSLSGEVTILSTGIDTLAAQIVDLKAQVEAEGGEITLDDLISLDQSIEDIRAQVKDARDKEQSA